MARVAPAVLDAADPDLARAYRAFRDELAAQGLTDRAGVFEAALSVARDPAARHPLLDRPTLVLDGGAAGGLELELAAAVVARSPDALCAVHSADAIAREHLEAAVEITDAAAHGSSSATSPTAIAALQERLFDEQGGDRSLGDDVLVLSAPGESRECIEIARHIVREAQRGLRFDEIAVLLRVPAGYRAHLVEALRRAGVPAYFTQGAVRPDPSGRALLALLACAAERLSARAFAEYLSLGVVPNATPQGQPPPAPPPPERWTPPIDDEVTGLETVGETPPEVDAPPGDGAAPRAPRRWERLLVDAAVIGGLDRWRRRLEGLSRALEVERQLLDDADDPRADAVDREIRDLETLRSFALPLLEMLASLPREPSWSWREWLEALSSLAMRSLRDPWRVLGVLSELAPMAPVGPVGLSEVQRVLGRRLAQLVERPKGSAAGAVFVASIEEARGLSFRTVLVPGLAEKVFPQKVSEDPLLLDDVRAALGDTALARNEDRVAKERLALHLAASAASERLVLSFPRVDTERARARVPSFYALEAVRAIEGKLPGFEELSRRAERGASARMGWPAPPSEADAIDAAEYDLAVLEPLLHSSPETTTGKGRFLLDANPHLARALRFRERRWWRKSWCRADGLVDPEPDAREALRKHALAERAFSPTALEAFASCPYRFYLRSIMGLAPREVPEAIDEIDPLQRGKLVHEVQFALLYALRAEKRLPVRHQDVEAAHEQLDRVLEAVASRYREELAPAIDRVWDDGIAAIRADLREWISRMANEPWVPAHFELAFGLGPSTRRADPESREDPVLLDNGIRLRGSIDLVERSGDKLRATDHKTGKARTTLGVVLGHGTSLQPVLYALALEKLFPGATVESGRLYYCTSAGDFTAHAVPLDEVARQAASLVAQTIGTAIDEAFLPAAPADGACALCDYRVVCGPYEEQRARRNKDPRPLLAVEALRRHT